MDERPPMGQAPQSNGDEIAMAAAERGAPQQRPRALRQDEPALSTRALNALQRLGIDSCDDLTDAHIEELAGLPQVGEKTVAEIVEACGQGPSGEAVGDAPFDIDAVHREIRSALGALEERKRDIIIARVLNEPAPTLQQIGEHLGVSRERVRQLEKKALTRFRANLGRTQDSSLQLIIRRFQSEAVDGNARSRGRLTDELSDRGLSPNALKLLSRLANWPDGRT